MLFSFLLRFTFLPCSMTDLSTDCMKRMGMMRIDERRRAGYHACEYGCAVHPTPLVVLVGVRGFYLPTVYEAQKRGRGASQPRTQRTTPDKTEGNSGDHTDGIREGFVTMERESAEAALCMSREKRHSSICSSSMRSNSVCVRACVHMCTSMSHFGIVHPSVFPLNALSSPPCVAHEPGPKSRRSPVPGLQSPSLAAIRPLRQRRT